MPPPCPLWICQCYVPILFYITKVPNTFQTLQSLCGTTQSKEKLTTKTTQGNLDIFVNMSKIYQGVEMEPFVY